MRLRTTLLVAVLVGSSLVVARNASADEANGLGMCPGYRVALQTARGALDSGKRAEAVAALRRAKAALENCRRQEARRRSLLAAAATLPPFLVHSSALLTSTNPFPLHSFLPLQEFSALAQPPWPLQALMPAQCTLPPVFSSARAVTCPERTSAAAAPAINMPFPIAVRFMGPFLGCGFGLTLRRMPRGSLEGGLLAALSNVTALSSRPN
jgi:hypothetical protein